MKIEAIRVQSYSPNKNDKRKMSQPLFCSNFDETSPATKVPPQIYFKPQLSTDTVRVKAKNLNESLNQLNSITFDPKDVEHIQSLGVVLPFMSGKEAFDFIKKSNIEIKFAKLESKNIHAQYDFDDNSININEIYKDSTNPAEILAISEAILHETGHAKDNDDMSSLQEEIDCLALNALSHRFLSKVHPDLFSKSNSLIVSDGVNVYSKLFFDSDPLKIGLIKRLKSKYGTLPVGDLKHPPSNLALDVKES